jgi:hypothetical protein
MIQHVTGLTIKTNKIHDSYKTKKGKLEQMMKIGSHASGIAPMGPLPGAYPIDGPSGGSVHAGASCSLAPFSSQDPSFAPLPHHGASHTYGVPKAKKNKMDFMAQGLFACFNMLRHEASEREKLTKWMVEEAHKQERRQKEIYAKLDMPHSPVHEPQVFTPPSPIDNPWENLASFVPDDGIEEEDVGGCEEDASESEEEEGSFHGDDDEEEDDAEATDGEHDD